ncbi:C25 family cysteine peptidase, partial [Candidatus Marithrix sp. Canyon 246]
MCKFIIYNILLFATTIVQANDIKIINSDAKQLIVEFNSCVSSGLLIQVPSTGNFWAELLDINKPVKELVELGVRQILRDIPVSRLRVLPCQGNYKVQKIRLKIHFENSLRKSRIKIFKTKPHQALRIETTKNGIYRIYYQQAVKAGMPAAIIPENLQLFNQGKQVAVTINLPEQYLEFYAESKVYWLYWNTNSLGKRINSIDSKAIHIEQDNIWGRHESKGFWQRLNALDVKNYNIPSQNSATTIKIAFYGYTTAAPHPNHHTLIYLNDNLIGDASWDGRTEYIQEMLVPASIFNQDSNILTIKLPGDTGAIVDSIFLDWIELHGNNSIINKIHSPKNISVWQSPELKNPNNGADYILITAKEFLPAVEPLAELRHQQGLRVKTVSVEDIYNEFNHG